MFPKFHFKIQYGQLGDGTTILKTSPILVVEQNSRIIDVCTGAYHNFILKATGHVYGFGRNSVRSFKF
jgi:alpha-tubulin suppressor-like RCC1 family protein